MKLRRQDTIAARESRTQGVDVAALRSRLRTPYRAGQRDPAAVASLLSGPPND